MKIENGKISDMQWSNERGLSCTLFIDFDNGAQGFGGYLLINNNSASKWILSLMEIFEVDRISDDIIKNKNVRVKHENDSDRSLIIAIGHPIKDIWFEPKRDLYI